MTKFAERAVSPRNAMAVDASKQEIDVAIFVALKDEFDTFQSRPPFSESKFLSSVTGFFAVYSFEFIDKLRKKRTGIFLLMEDMGDRAKDAFYYVRDRYNPQYIISSGISGAVQSDLFAGDVVLSSSVSTPFSKGKAIPGQVEAGDIDLLLAGDVAPTAEAEARRIRSIWNGNSKTLSSRESLARSLADLRKAWEMLPEKARGLAAEFIEPILDRGQIAVVVGPTVAIPTVLASSALRHKILLRDRKIAAVDMESGYIADSVAISGIVADFLSVRAISDFGDENKSRLEDATKNILRGWAVSNLAEVLTFALQDVLDFSRAAQASDTSAQQIQGEPSVDAKLPTGHARRRQYPSGYIETRSFDIEIWDRRYASLAHARTTERYRKSPLSEILRLCRGAAEKQPQFVQLRGGQGSGKSTFLDALYFAAQRHEQEFKVAHIDLQSYRTKAEEFPDRDVKGIVEMEINNTLRSLGPAARILILVDNALDDAATHSAIGHFGKSSSARFGSVVVVAAPEQQDGRGHADSIVGNWTAVIDLGAIPVAGESAEKLVSTFSEAVRGKLITETALGNVLKRLAIAEFKEIDPQIVSVALRYEAADRKIGEMRNPVEFALGWRDQFLRENIQVDRIADARESANLYAFMHYLDELDEYKAEFPFAAVYSRLCSSHSIVRSALIADFICSSLRWFQQASKVVSEPTALERCRLRALGMVFEKTVTVALKSRILLETQNTLVSQISSIIESRQLRLLPLCVYLLGRLTEKSAQRYAKESLKRLERESEGGFASWHQEDEDDRLVDFCRRAVFISLAYLDDIDAATKYAAEIFSNPAAASLNRGFHREYHQDSVVDSKRGLDGYLLEDDPEGSWSNTRAVLAESLSKVSRGRLSSRNIVELATYCSFLASRLELGKVPLEERSQHIDFLADFQRQDNPLREHAELLVAALKQRTQRVGFGFVLRGLARLKHEPRAGWGRMKVGSALGHPVETVGSHVFGMALLAELLLPAVAPDDFPYDKAKVIRLVLAHDLGESIIGDRTPDQVERGPLDEKRAIGRISAAELFTNLSGLSDLRNLYEDFGSKDSPEAKIAHDFDCLDPLLQMFIYRRSSDNILEVERFIDGYSDRVTTPIGRQLLVRLKEEVQDWISQPDTVGTVPPRSLET
ncbi:HD domain-containing protein [Bradyrhizobium stylosanthis]|uniref:HD domain-containing protein n=1 Tax=Bradyrhizobium stylosanthis TaxID=1803665 RepID=UPI0016474028|nr:HD domain-containing protein [Bradyrhizobium stylosanthis]